MQRLCAGHDAALNELMERHGGKLFHYLVRQVGNEDDATDLAQETFVRIYKHRERFDPAHKFSTWLYTIATNLSRDRLKWRSRRPEISLQTPIGDEGTELEAVLPDQKRSPDADLLLSERAQAVQRAIAGLSTELREPLVMAEYENMATADIAEVLGCTPKAVESKLYRARLQLRARLAKWLETEPLR